MTVLVGTAGGLFRLGDTLGPPMLAGHDVGALAPAADGGRWILADGRVLWHGEGDEWRAVAQAPGLRRATCVADVGGTVLVGTTEGHLLRLAGTTLEPLLTFEEVEGRDGWYTPWGGPADVRSLDGVDATILVNVHVGGVLRSADGGATWRPTIDLHADVHQVRAGVAGRATAVAASAVGLATSPDGGETWSVAHDGLHATYCRAVAVADGTVLVSASTGPSGGRSCLYRRALHDDGPFARCDGGLPEWFGDNVDTFCLDARGAEAACGAPDGTLWISADAGQTWQARARALPPIRCVAVC